MEKKYGGYTAAELRELIAQTENSGGSLDTITMSAAVIRDLLDALSAPAEATQAGTVPVGRAQGIEAVAAMLEKKADDYANDHGSVDPDTGALEFGTGPRALAKLEYWSELSELADEVRAMLAAAPQAPVADAARGEPVRATDRVNLDGWQLLEALNYLAPDRDTDPDQLDGDVTIQFGNGHSGEALYCWNGEYHDDGAFVLDGSTVDRDTLTQQPARASEARDSQQLADWLLTDPQTGEPLHFAGPLEPDFLRFSRVKMQSKSGAVWTLSARLEEGYLTAAERLENIKRAAREDAND